MSVKRSLALNIYNKRRKVTCIPSEVNETTGRSECGVDKDPMSSTESAFHHLRTLFPKEKFEGRIPPIVMKHQIYALVSNKTNVDKRLDELRNEGNVRFFKIGPRDDDLAVVLTSDYEECVLMRNKGKKALESFISNAVLNCPNVSYRKNDLTQNYSFTEENISELVQCGVLTVRDVGTWWLAIPHVGEFVKCYLKGQKTLISTIRRCKYKEILRHELENKKLAKGIKLGMEYHLYDIIGAELVLCIETSSGQLLRLND